MTRNEDPGAGWLCVTGSLSQNCRIWHCALVFVNKGPVILLNVWQREIIIVITTLPPCLFFDKWKLYCSRSLLIMRRFFIAQASWNNFFLTSCLFQMLNIWNKGVGFLNSLEFLSVFCYCSGICSNISVYVLAAKRASKAQKGSDKCL